MIRRQLTIRSLLLLTAVAALVFSLVLILVFWDASRGVAGQERILELRSTLLKDAWELEQSYMILLGEPGIRTQATFLEHLGKLESSVTAISGISSGDSAASLMLRISQVMGTLERLAAEMPQAGTADAAVSGGSQARISLLASQVSELDRELAAGQMDSHEKLKNRLLVTFLAGAVLIVLLLLLVYTRINRALAKLAPLAGKLGAGELPASAAPAPRDEFGQIIDNLNGLIDNLREKLDYVSSLSSESHLAPYEPERKDALGMALKKLAETLTEKEVAENARNREDKRQNWVSGGMARLGEVLRSETGNVRELAFSVVQNLVKYMEVEMGSLYTVRNDLDGKPYLELSATYAYDRRKYNTGRLEWGEGLPGTCAQEMKRIFITEVPEDYFEIQSGTGSVKPNCLLLVPMIINEEVRGIIELATVKLLRPFEIEFVETIAESVAATLLMVENNMRNEELLQQSQEQARELREKEEAMLESMKKLEEAQSESLRKESELTGILNAMNQSVPVAELGMNRRYTEVNGIFLEALGLQKDQVVGKLHSEVAEADPYSDEYKGFWDSLKQGKPARMTELYRLHTGKELWLKQSYTPIANEAGRVFKVLSIAEDVTETLTLQQKLKDSMAEVTRSQLDMKTLSEAVNSSLIKCELDAEEVIMAVNDNYVQVSGYSRKELLGRSYRLFLKEPEKEQFEKIWAEVAKHKVYEGVIRRTRPTGEETWLVSTFSPVVDESGTVHKVYFLGLDITEKKLKYQLLEEANLEIERLRARLKELEL